MFVTSPPKWLAYKDKQILAYRRWPTDKDKQILANRHRQADTGIQTKTSWCWYTDKDRLIHTCLWPLPLSDWHTDKDKLIHTYLRTLPLHIAILDKLKQCLAYRHKQAHTDMFEVYASLDTCLRTLPPAHGYFGQTETVSGIQTHLCILTDMCK